MHRPERGKLLVSGAYLFTHRKAHSAGPETKPLKNKRFPAFFKNVFYQACHAIKLSHRVLALPRRATSPKHFEDHNTWKT